MSGRLKVRRVDHVGLCSGFGPGESFVWAVFEGENPVPLAHFYDWTTAVCACGWVTS
jgi:hypothetical protein